MRIWVIVQKICGLKRKQPKVRLFLIEKHDHVQKGDMANQWLELLQ